MAEQPARMLHSRQLPLAHSSGGFAAQVGSDLFMFPSLFLPHSASTNHWHNSPPLVRVCEREPSHPLGERGREKERQAGNSFTTGTGENVHSPLCHGRGRCSLD